MQKLIFILTLVATNLATYYYVSNSNAPRGDIVAEPVQVKVVSAPSRPIELAKAAPAEIQQRPESSLEAVGQALLSMEDSQLKSALIDVFTSGWFTRDHIALAEWLNEQAPDVNTDQALASFANLASEIDPEGAVEWAASVMTPSLREQALKRSVSDFRRFDPAGFNRFMEGGTLTARAIRNAGIIELVQDGDVAERFDILEDAPEPTSRILARRTRLAGSSSRVNNVQLTLD